jgi:hypothetical protein
MHLHPIYITIVMLLGVSIASSIIITQGRNAIMGARGIEASINSWLRKGNQEFTRDLCSNSVGVPVHVLCEWSAMYRCVYMCTYIPVHSAYLNMHQVFEKVCKWMPVCDTFVRMCACTLVCVQACVWKEAYKLPGRHCSRYFVQSSLNPTTSLKAATLPFFLR